MRLTAGLGATLVGLSLLLAACQQPYRVFAVQIASGANPQQPGAPADSPGRASNPTLRGAQTWRTTPAPARGGAPHTPWDLNRAPRSLLRQLPGMDPATLARVLAGRPYRRKRDLLKRGILTPAQYARWKNRLVVHRGEPAASAGAGLGSAGKQWPEPRPPPRSQR